VRVSIDCEIEQAFYFFSENRNMSQMKVINQVKEGNRLRPKSDPSGNAI